MYIHSTTMIAAAGRIRDALELEPAITLDLSGAGPTDVAIFIFCRMWRGVDEPEAIQADLMSRGCRFDRETIGFLLAIYEGDDPARHLWERDENEGFYLPLFAPVAGEEVALVN